MAISARDDKLSWPMHDLLFVCSRLKELALLSHSQLVARVLAHILRSAYIYLERDHHRTPQELWVTDLCTLCQHFFKHFREALVAFSWRTDIFSTKYRKRKLNLTSLHLSITERGQRIYRTTANQLNLWCIKTFTYVVVNLLY